MVYTELTINQGTTFIYNIDLKQDDGSNLNLSTSTFSGQIRKSYYSRKETANIVINVIDAANGKINLYISAANTANIAAGRYLYDVKMANNTSNVVTRIYEGVATVTPQVTK
jgi:hypothetical protein